MCCLVLVCVLFTRGFAGQTRGGAYYANFLRSVIFPFFPNDQNSGYLYDIKFIFGRCHRSWAAETPGKYEHDWNYLTYTYAKSKFPVMEKLANRALVTPVPAWWGIVQRWCCPWKHNKIISQFELWLNYDLTHCGLRCHYRSASTFGSANGLLPIWSKLLPKSLVTYCDLNTWENT